MSLLPCVLLALLPFPGWVIGGGLFTAAPGCVHVCARACLCVCVRVCVCAHAHACMCVHACVWSFFPESATRPAVQAFVRKRSMDVGSGVTAALARPPGPPVLFSPASSGALVVGRSREFPHVGPLGPCERSSAP